ncbi:MAG: hypothetical protein FWF88_10600 [Peptococcaceae bacterium]|nr:hypothetical protein [Peptococcaceae bacterium]
MGRIIPWRKIVVIGSAFLLGVSAGLGMVMATDPSFNPTFASKDTVIQANYAPDSQTDSLPTQAPDQTDGLTQAEQAKIIDDYKMSLALLFEAWRSPDMRAFEAKILDAYLGEIKDRHLDRAQMYISNGKGLYIDDLKFDLIQIESADASEAQIAATYMYTARDFDLEKTQAFGQKVNHEVHVRAILNKVGNRWLIVGETSI